MHFYQEELLQWAVHIQFTSGDFNGLYIFPRTQMSQPGQPQAPNLIILGPTTRGGLPCEKVRGAYQINLGIV